MVEDSWSAYVRRVRATLGVNQSELAARLHVTTRSVSRWETGKGRPDLASRRELRTILYNSSISLKQSVVEARPVYSIVRTLSTNVYDSTIFAISSEFSRFHGISNAKAARGITLQQLIEMSNAPDAFWNFRARMGYRDERLRDIGIDRVAYVSGSHDTPDCKMQFHRASWTLQPLFIDNVLSAEIFMRADPIPALTDHSTLEIVLVDDLLPK